MNVIDPIRRVYLDTEYCYPGMARSTPRPTSADRREIVQIAAVLFDASTGEEMEHLDQIVRPASATPLPAFFTELTGISQNRVEAEGIAFAEALHAFVEFCDIHPVWTFDKDEEVLRQNCVYIDFPWPFKESFVRVKSLLPGWGIDPNRYSSGTLTEAVGLAKPGHVHDALHDARSMAQAVHKREWHESLRAALSSVPDRPEKLVPTPADFVQMTLEQIAVIATPDLIHISDVYVHTCTFPSAALTTRETKALKSCIRVIVQELRRRATTNDPHAGLLQKYLT